MHDRFFSTQSSKEGTRYERLAAAVLKSLGQQSVVIHDFRLRGDSTVKHQIDILIQVGGLQKRTLIECKDFDKSGRLVGIGVLRDFRSVVEDTKADEAFVLTCTGYTRPARKYAKAKGIKLAVMRVLEDQDWEDRIKQVNINLHIQVPPRLERTDLSFATSEQAKAFIDEAAAHGISLPRVVRESPVYLVGNDEQIHVLEYLDREADRIAAPTFPTSHEINLDPEIWKIRVGSHEPHAFTLLRFVLRSIPILTRQLQIDMGRVAELIVKGFGDEDIIIFAEQLQRAKIDSKGHVTYEPAPTTSVTART
ncbi:MAG: restriction endonuclease [Steroidobacteraceae bacterium]